MKHCKKSWKIVKIHNKKMMKKMMIFDDFFDDFFQKPCKTNGISTFTIWAK
jgi:hypothetical protein